MLLGEVSRVYGLLAPTMNFRPKKTECFLKDRGKDATVQLQRRRTGPDGSLEVRIPDGGPAIRVVRSYGRFPKFHRAFFWAETLAH